MWYRFTNKCLQEAKCQALINLKQPHATDNYGEHHRSFRNQGKRSRRRSSDFLDHEWLSHDWAQHAPVSRAMLSECKSLSCMKQRGILSEISASWALWISHCNGVFHEGGTVKKRHIHSKRRIFYKQLSHLHYSTLKTCCRDTHSTLLTGNCITRFALTWFKT